MAFLVLSTHFYSLTNHISPFQTVAQLSTVLGLLEAALVKAWAAFARSAADLGAERSAPTAARTAPKELLRATELVLNEANELQETHGGTGGVVVESVCP